MMQVRSQLVVRVTPNARHSEILGWGMDEKGRSVLMVKLAAAPVDGKANLELIKFIAKMLDCAKRQVVLPKSVNGKAPNLARKLIEWANEVSNCPSQSSLKR